MTSTYKITPPLKRSVAARDGSANHEMAEGNLKNGATDREMA